MKLPWRALILSSHFNIFNVFAGPVQIVYSFVLKSRLQGDHLAGLNLCRHLFGSSTASVPIPPDLRLKKGESNQGSDLTEFGHAGKNVIVW